MPSERQLGSLSHLDVSVLDDIDNPDRFLIGESSGIAIVLNILGAMIFFPLYLGLFPFEMEH